MTDLRLQAAPTEEDGQRIAILDAVGSMLAAKRAEAVAARAQSGIENDWTQDEEFYQGYDDANRHEFVNSVSKPSADGQMRDADATSAGSTVFPNITQPYVDAVAARVGDMLLPTDDRNYAVNATPMPEMLQALPAQPVVPPEAPAAPQATQGQPGMPPEGAPAGAPIVSEADQAKAEYSRMKAEAGRKAKLAEDQIDDWLQECQYHAEIRQVIDDASRLGSGVIKGPVPIKRKSSVWMPGDEAAGTAAGLVIVEEIKPASFRVDPWNLFPDAACGENIHNGSYIFERDFMTSKKLENLKGVPGYIDSQIDKCLDEGPGNRKESGGRIQSVSKEQFEIWYAHITITAEEMKACGVEVGDDKRSYPALMTMVNNHVIRAALNPLDSGVFPYDVIPWKRRPGMPWGMGLGRQLRTPQRIVVGASRRLMDNAGQGSGPQFVVRRGVQPENGIWEIKPLKIWIEEDDAAGNVSSPVSSVVIPMMQVELMNIIQLGMKMAEDVTGMPMLLQGQQGSAPDTVGGMTILNNNANAVLRRIARLFDSSITEPHIRRYYAWLMEYGENDDTKGDFQIIARGSTALVERDIQSQEMVSVLQLCLNPAFGKNPKLAMNEYLKSRRFDSAAFDYTEEEQAQMDQQQAPADPRIKAAQILAASRTEIAAASEAMREKIAAAGFSNEEFIVGVNNENADADRALREQEMRSKDAREIEKLKKDLAVVTMKLRVQVEEGRLMRAQADDYKLSDVRTEMFNHDNPAIIAPVQQPVIEPVIEPAGKASPGLSFTQ